MGWFTKVCIWVTVRLTCFRSRAQRSGTRNRERREADYEYEYEYEHECNSHVESCKPELNQALNMFERFTDRARKCVQLAKRKALELNQQQAEPAHLLYGILEQASGVGFNVLKNLDVSLESLKTSITTKLTELPKSAHPPVDCKEIELSAASRKLLGRLMKDIAAPFNHNYVGTDHLLLGLLQDQTCGGILRENGVAADEFTMGMLNLLSGGMETGHSCDRISITLTLPEFVDTQSVEDALVQLFASLDGMNRALGGPGLEVDEGELFLIWPGWSGGAAMTDTSGAQNAKEHLQLTATPKDDSGPGLIEQMAADLRDALPGLLTDLSGSGRGWMRGKSEQEVARAKEILSHAIERIGRMALDEQDQKHRHQLESSNHDLEIQRKQADLYLTSLERVVGIAKDLNEMGVVVDLRRMLGLTSVFRKILGNDESST